MHLTILVNIFKCCKCHNHTSFFDCLSLEVVEELLKNKVRVIKYLLQCSMSSAYRQKKASKKRGHLIAQVHNTEVKWSIKTCIVRTKKSYQGIETEIISVDNEKFKCA